MRYLSDVLRIYYQQETKYQASEKGCEHKLRFALSCMQTQNA